MRYFKNVEDGYIISTGTGPGYMEITAVEYERILEKIHTRPVAEDGYDHRLKADLTWEMMELPQEEIIEEEATEEDYLEALSDLGVEV